MQRSLLFVPADSDRKLAKAEGCGADGVILDLEDSVLPARKREARGLAREYLLSHAAGPPLWVRVNDLTSGFLLDDLHAVVSARPVGILLPKIRGPEDLLTVSHYLDALAHGGDAPSDIALMALVTETPAAMLRIHELLSVAVPRLRGIAWGAEDLSAALGAGNPRDERGAWRPLYEQARGQCLLAAHALGIAAIDTVYVDFRDLEGLKAACGASRHDGFTGRLAIHPDQVPIINEAFTATAAEVALAQRLVAAFAHGAGSVSLDGRMYDIPHLRAAQQLLAKAADAQSAAPP